MRARPPVPSRVEGRLGAWSPAWRYGAAIVGVGLATAACLLLDPTLRPRQALNLYLPVLVACAWILGPGPTLVGLGSGLAAMFGLLISPTDWWRTVSAEDATQIGVSLAIVVGALAAARHAHRRTAVASAVVDEKQALLRAVVQTAVDGIITIDERGMILTVNPAVERTFGYSAPELIGQNVRILMPAPYHQEHDAYLENYHRTGHAKIIGIGREVKGRRKDGTEFPLDLAVAETRLGDHRIYTGLLRDITLRKQAEQTLHESREEARRQLAELEAIYDTAPVGLCFLDRDLRHVRANAMLAASAGATPAAVHGRTVREVYPSWGGSVEAVIRDVLATGKARLGIPLHARAGAGPSSEHTFLVSYHPVLGGDGSALGVNVVMQDVTELTRLEGQLQQAQKMEALGQLAGGVAHDVNNALMAIFNYARLAQKSLTPDHPAMGHLQRLNQAAGQAASVTRLLLTFARRDAGSKAPVDLSVVVQHAADMIRPLLPAAIRLYSETGPRALWVTGNAQRIQQVLINLATNARDAMHNGGDLWISARVGQARPGTACLVVRDNGPGMTPEVRARMFDPFFTTKPHGQGTGLGLSIVDGIVREHRGSIDVQTAAGEGTTFTVEFPTIAPPRGEPQNTSPPAAAPAYPGCVLLADDNLMVQELLAGALRTSGFEVHTAGDGLEFLRLARANAGRFDVLVVDIDMPGRSGLACLQDLRGEGWTTPAIVITGNTLDAPPVDENSSVLAKPFEVDELVALAQKHTAARRGRAAGDVGQPSPT